MFFLILSFLIASVGFTYEFETMAKFESAYAIIRRINFQTVDDVTHFCGVYETKCINRRGYSIQKIFTLEEDSSEDSYRLFVHVSFYPGNSCVIRDKMMDLDIHNQLKTVSKKYHRVEITTSNVYISFPQVLPEDYKCNIRAKSNEPMTLKTYICSHNDNRDIFKSIRALIRKSYPASAFFTSNEFSVSDSSGGQLRLYHTSNKNCDSKDKSESQSDDDTKPIIPVSAFTKKNPVILHSSQSSGRSSRRSTTTTTTKKGRIVPTPIPPKQLDADAIIKSIEEVERGNNYVYGDERRDESEDTSKDSFKYEIVTFNKEQAIANKGFSFSSRFFEPDNVIFNSNSFIRRINIIVHFLLLGALIYVFYMK